MINNEKYLRLRENLQKLKKVVLAFSGGVDSTFLLKVAQEVLGEQVKAVTIRAPYIPRWEIAEAQELVRQLGVAHEIIDVPLIEEIRFNPQDRCYHCKRAVFDVILAVAAREGYHYVIDGTNFDDTADYRPGLRALRELKVKSPLLESGLAKQEIRSFSKELGLKTWDKPSYACLLTRIPYGYELIETDFQKIEQAEKYLMEQGLRGVRVRCHGNLARIEVEKEEMEKLFDQRVLEQISYKLQNLGFTFVTLDLAGYRVGSFNGEGKIDHGKR